MQSEALEGRPHYKKETLMTDFKDIPYRKEQEPDFNYYLQGWDSIKKERLKFYLYIKDKG
jgi:hypothetical protein